MSHHIPCCTVVCECDSANKNVQNAIIIIMSPEGALMTIVLHCIVVAGSGPCRGVKKKQFNDGEDQVEVKTCCS